MSGKGSAEDFQELVKLVATTLSPSANSSPYYSPIDDEEPPQKFLRKSHSKKVDNVAKREKLKKVCLGL